MPGQAHKEMDIFDRAMPAFWGGEPDYDGMVPKPALGCDGASSRRLWLAAWLETTAQLTYDGEKVPSVIRLIR